MTTWGRPGKVSWQAWIVAIAGGLWIGARSWCASSSASTDSSTRECSVMEGPPLTSRWPITSGSVPGVARSARTTSCSAWAWSRIGVTWVSFLTGPRFRTRQDGFAVGGPIRWASPPDNSRSSGMAIRRYLSDELPQLKTSTFLIRSRPPSSRTQEHRPDCARWPRCQEWPDSTGPPTPIRSARDTCPRSPGRIRWPAHGTR